MINVSEDFVHALIGCPPVDWDEKLERAMELVERNARDPVAPEEQMEDIFLLAACAFYHTKRDHLAGFISRARQVAKWVSNNSKSSMKEATPQSPAVLRNKVQEVGRMVSRHLFANEEFLVIIYDRQDPSHTGSISSAPVEDQVQLLQRHLEYLKHESDQQ